MKLFLAGATGDLWDMMSCAMNDMEADVALLQPLKAFVDIAVPQAQPMDQGPILVLQEGGKLELPSTPLLLCHTNPLPCLNTHRTEWVVAREAHH